METNGSIEDNDPLNFRTSTPFSDIWRKKLLSGDKIKMLIKNYFYIINSEI